LSNKDMAGKVPNINIVYSDFERIRKLSDLELVTELEMLCRKTKQRVVPAEVSFNHYGVSRAADRVTLHLAQNGEDACRVSFVPNADVGAG
jgi:hypothetical protein